VLYPSPQGWGLETHEGAVPLPGKCKLHAEKVKFGAYFCMLLLFQCEIIVDSIHLRDLVQALGARRLTPVSGRLQGIPGDLGCLTLMLTLTAILLTLLILTITENDKTDLFLMNKSTTPLQHCHVSKYTVHPAYTDYWLSGCTSRN